DFRAGERTFQLLVQVAGRAGRGDIEGEVVVQSFTPFHPAIQYARRHDYCGFYDQEIEFRQQLSYPPITRMACITLRGASEDKVKFVAETVARGIKTAAEPRNILVAGPTPAPLAKIKNQYRYQIMLRTENVSRLTETLHATIAARNIHPDVSLSVDV